MKEREHGINEGERSETAGPTGNRSQKGAGGVDRRGGHTARKADHGGARAHPRTVDLYREVTIKAFGIVLECAGVNLILYLPDVGVVRVIDVMGDGQLWTQGEALRAGAAIWVDLRSDCLPMFVGQWRAMPVFDLPVFEGTADVASPPKRPSSRLPLLRWWQQDRRDDVTLAGSTGFFTPARS